MANTNFTTKICSYFPRKKFAKKVKQGNYRSVELEVPAFSFDGHTDGLAGDGLQKRLLIVVWNIFVGVDGDNVVCLLLQRRGPPN
jgi:hypothetical protein